LSYFKTTLAGLALSIMLPAMASAAPITVRDNAADNGASVFSAGLGRGVTIDYLETESDVGAGVFSLEYGSDADGWVEFLTFCLQISERLTLPNDHERVSGDNYFADQEDRDAIGALFNNFLTTDLGLADATSAAALQVILWEVVEDGAANFDLTMGDFEVVTNSVRNRANTLWGLIVSGLDNDEFVNIAFDVFVAEGTQDLLVETPLPGALALLMSGVAGLGFASRKKKPV